MAAKLFTSFSWSKFLCSPSYWRRLINDRYKCYYICHDMYLDCIICWARFGDMVENCLTLELTLTKLLYALGVVCATVLHSWLYTLPMKASLVANSRILYDRLSCHIDNFTVRLLTAKPFMKMRLEGRCMAVRFNFCFHRGSTWRHSLITRVGKVQGSQRFWGSAFFVFSSS